MTARRGSRYAAGSMSLTTSGMLILRWIARMVLIAFLVEAAAAAMFLLVAFEVVPWDVLRGPAVYVLTRGEQTFEALGPAWPILPAFAAYAILEPVFAPIFRDLFSPVVGSLREAASPERRTAD
jgi:hypothetical protein